MKILQIFAIALLGVSFAMIVKPYRPEMALLTAVVTGLVALAYVFADLSGIVENLAQLAERYSVNAEVLDVLVRIIGVAYLTHLGSKICLDAGESAISAKVEMCGRILILSAALPSLISALGTASELLASLAH